MSASGTQIAYFYRQLAELIDAGVPYVKAFATLEKHCRGGIRKAAALLREEIAAGSNFTEAAEKLPWLFPPMQLNLVRVAEKTGRLDDILRSLADHKEAQIRMRRLIIGKFIYPVLVVHAALLIRAVMIWFRPGDSTAPAVMFLVLSFGTLYGAAFVIYAIWQWRNLIPGLASALSGFAWNMPFIGKMVRTRGTARFAMTLNLVIRAGTGLQEGLQLAIATCGSQHMERRLMPAIDAIGEGENLGDALIETGVFTPMVNQMIVTGVESGSLDKMMEKVSETCNEDYEHTLNQVAIVLPMLFYFLVMAGMAWMIISMYAAQFRVVLEMLE